jgi:hypothetical protein
MYRRVLFVGVLPLTSPNTATQASLGCVLAIMSVAYFREEQPYRVKYTNFIAYIAQYVILVTFYAALAINTGTMVTFGLGGVGMGVALLLVNLSIFGLALWLGWERYRRDRARHERLQRNADRVEEAAYFNDEKFKTTFDAIAASSVPAFHVLAFHYTSAEVARMARHSGLPADAAWGGIPFTLRRPHQASAAGSPERAVFMSRGDRFQTIGSKSQELAFDSVLAFALPTRLLEPLPGFEHDPCLFRLTDDVFRSLRPTTFSTVLNPWPWLRGCVLLPPTAVVRHFSLTADVDADGKEKHHHRDKELLDEAWLIDDDVAGLGVEKNGRSRAESEAGPNLASPLASSRAAVVSPSTVGEYLDAISALRSRAHERGLVTLYHYTSPKVVALILEGGLRMSTQGQGDGGVYFSTLSPASYGLGKVRTCTGAVISRHVPYLNSISRCSITFLLIAWRSETL